MKIKSKSYPYPVLSWFSDDYIDSSFDAHVLTEVNDDSSKVIFTAKFNLINSVLEQLIIDGKAKYGIHIECDAGMFRHLETSSNKVFKFEVDQKFLNRSIEVSYLIIADTMIENYRNPLFHTDYSGMSFNLERGAHLAVAKGKILFIEKTPISPVKSIFNLSINSKSDQIEIEYGDIISILLPQNVYGQVEDLKGYEETLPLLISIYYMPALIDALFYIQSLSADEDGFTSVEESAWFCSIKYQLEKLNIDLNSMKDLKLTEIAFQILKDFDQISLKSLNLLLFGEDDSHEEFDEISEDEKGD